MIATFELMKKLQQSRSKISSQARYQSNRADPVRESVLRALASQPMTSHELHDYVLNDFGGCARRTTLRAVQWLCRVGVVRAVGDKCKHTPSLTYVRTDSIWARNGYTPDDDYYPYLDQLRRRTARRPRHGTRPSGREDGSHPDGESAPRSLAHL